MQNRKCKFICAQWPYYEVSDYTRLRLLSSDTLS